MVSPDFNPIEKAFSKLKAMLRKASERTVTGLWDLIGRLVDLFQPTECANYFSSCGYDPDRTESALARKIHGTVGFGVLSAWAEGSIGASRT